MLDLVFTKQRILYVNIHQWIEQSEYFEKPNNDHNYNDNVEDSFDFSIHRNVIIDEP